MADITYITGDATRPQDQGAKIIVHICNDIGGWGKGFVVAISRRWPEPEQRTASGTRNARGTISASVASSSFRSRTIPDSQHRPSARHYSRGLRAAHPV